MDLINILQQSGAIGGIAQQLGVNESVAQMGATALLPAILGGFKSQAQAQPTGLDGLGGLLQQFGGGGLLDAVAAPEPAPVDQGNSILGQIFGSKDVSRTVAGHAAEQTGIDSSLLKQMLPMLAMAVAGYMAKQHSGQSGGIGDLIGGALGGGQSSGGLGGMLGNVIGGMMGGGQSTAPAVGGLGGLANMLDFDGDGNPLDDIIGMAGKLGR